MLHKFIRGVEEEKGFTLIELLVVILIIGILAAIAIPTFLNQTSKANDSSAKSLAQTAETAMETSATDNNGTFSAITSPATLQAVEPSIPISAANNQAYLSAATNTNGGAGYTLTTTAAGTGDTFTIVNNGTGSVTRTCVAKNAGNKAGCQTGSW